MNIDIKKRIIEALDDFSAKHPHVAIMPKYKKDFIREGLNTFNASNIESCTIEWVRGLHQQEQFKKMFLLPRGSGASGSTASDYSYRPSISKDYILSEPEWNIWKLRPTATVTELSYLSLGHDPQIHDNLMNELDKANNYQSYSIARLICDTADNIKKMTTTIIRNLERNGGSLPEFRKSLYDQDTLIKLTDFVVWLDRQNIPYPEQLKNCGRVQQSVTSERPSNERTKGALTQENNKLKQLFNSMIELHYYGKPFDSDGKPVTSGKIEKDFKEYVDLEGKPKKLLGSKNTIDKHLTKPK